MQERKLAYPENGLAFWVIKIALVFSVFLFSGYTGHLEAASQKSVNTELVIPQKNTIHKDVLSIEKLLKSSGQAKSLLLFKAAQKKALWKYNQSLKIAYQSLQQNFLVYKCALLIRLKIPRFTLDQNFSSLL